MADANRGRGSGRGRGRGRGVDPEDEERRQHDQRDLELAAIRERIGELERQLAEARLGSTLDEEESETLDSSEADNGDEDLNPWGDPNLWRNQGFRSGFDQSYQNLGVKFDKDKEPVYDDYGDEVSEPVYDDYGDGDENPPSEEENKEPVVEKTNVRETPLEEPENNAESLVDVELEKEDKEAEDESNTNSVTKESISSYETGSSRLNIASVADLCPDAVVTSVDFEEQQFGKNVHEFPTGILKQSLPKSSAEPPWELFYASSYQSWSVAKAHDEDSVPSLVVDIIPGPRRAEILCPQFLITDDCRKFLLIAGVLLEMYVFDPGVPREVVDTSIIVGGTYLGANLVVYHQTQIQAELQSRISRGFVDYDCSSCLEIQDKSGKTRLHSSMILVLSNEMFEGHNIGKVDEVADSRTNLFLEEENDADKAQLIETTNNY